MFNIPHTVVYIKLLISYSHSNNKSHQNQSHSTDSELNSV
jgi:hypothetical protein